MRSANIFDYAIIGAYFLFMLGIGFYFMRINKGAREYFAGGNLIPWWVSGMTLYMANFSAWTFTGAAGFAYSTGWFSLLYFGLSSIAYWFGSSLTAAKWRRTRSISPVEYTHTRFNVTTQQFLGWVIASNYILAGGVQLAATCKLLAPIIHLDITTLTIITGIVILLYTFAGGIWAVSVTDVVQGVILLGITLVVMPLSLSLVGGIGGLMRALPPLALEHTYQGFHYTEHWLVSIFFIMSIGVAAGQAQRFYSVKDEKSAKRVGRFASLLFLSVPLVFGIPPLVARVIWPDLSAVDFFKPYAGKNPQDLVFIAMCLKLLPNGLVGVFVAAMLAATMSTLSAVYNLVSSIISRDIIQGLFRPATTDGELLRIGRRTSVALGCIVTLLAILFIHSEIGIFNMMQVFYTLLNIPVVVPIAFGLLFRKPNRWSALAGIVWGLAIGVVTRYLLSWDMGPQVYAQILMTSAVFLASRPIGGLYRKRRGALALISLCVAALLFGVLFAASGALESWKVATLLAAATAIGGSLFFFGRLFAGETGEQRAEVDAFFRKLDTPVDVAAEVLGAGKKEVSTFPLVGGTTIAMGLLLSLLLFTGLSGAEKGILGVMIALMILFGSAMWYFGGRGARRMRARERAGE